MTRENLGKMWMYAQAAAFYAVVCWFVAVAPMLLIAAIYNPDFLWPLFKIVSGYELLRLWFPPA
jgi:hypothetical protein